MGDAEMIPSAELQARVEDMIRNYCGAASEEPDYLKDLAGQYHVLPILIDWTAFWGLRPDGSIFLIPTEDDVQARPEGDERMCRVAIFRGAKKYPELKPLVPVRPPDAPDCPHCEGHGRIDIPGVEPDTIICFCGGSGWVTQGEFLQEQRG
jgi:hypothetical protein